MQPIFLSSRKGATLHHTQASSLRPRRPARPCLETRGIPAEPGDDPMSHSHDVFCTILPPHILKHMASTDDPEVRDRAHHSLEVAAAARGRRAVLGPMAAIAGV